VIGSENKRRPVDQMQMMSFAECHDDAILGSFIK